MHNLMIILLQWANLCGSYLVEARWFSRGHKPTLKEYLGNAWTSVGGPAAIVHAYLLQAEECNLTEHSLINCLKDGYEIIYWSSLIARLSNDLGTSMVTFLTNSISFFLKKKSCLIIYNYCCLHLYIYRLRLREGTWKNLFSAA